LLQLQLLYKWACLSMMHPLSRALDPMKLPRHLPSLRGSRLRYHDTPIAGRAPKVRSASQNSQSKLPRRDFQLFWKKRLRLRAYLGGMLKGNDATTWAEKKQWALRPSTLGQVKATVSKPVGACSRILLNSISRVLSFLQSISNSYIQTADAQGTNSPTY
jgi:hypothetical protein